MPEIENSTIIRAQVEDQKGKLERIEIDPAKVDEIHSRGEGLSMTIVLIDGTEIEALHLSFFTA